MDHGAIAQIGAPEELYDQPANAYVANFIGAANILPVRVDRQAGDRHVMVSMAGFEFRCIDGGVTPGSEAKLITRPEHLVIAKGEAGLGSLNVIKGQIKRRQYLGARTAYSVAFGDGLTIMAEHHAGAHLPALDEGQGVDVFVPMTARIVAA